MSKTRKILSVVLAAALVFALAIPAFAESSVNFESPADAAKYTQEWSLAKPVFIEDDELFPDHIGEYYIDVILKTNYPTGAVEFEVETTGDVELVGAEMFEYYSYMNEFDEMCWDADFRFDGGKAILVPDSSSVEDAVVFTQIDEKGAEVGFSIATIFVSGTNGTVAIKDEPKNAENTGGSLIATRLNPAKITGTMIVGQTANVGAAVTIGIPVLKGINGGYVDEARKYVYGIPAETTFEGLSGLFTVENGSFVTLDGVGTGKTLTVKDNAGEVYDEYTIIIFGDVNGDNQISGADDVIVSVAALGAPINEAASAFAADINGDSAISGADTVVVSVAALGGAITTNPYAVQ